MKNNKNLIVSIVVFIVFLIIGYVGVNFLKGSSEESPVASNDVEKVYNNDSPQQATDNSDTGYQGQESVNTPETLSAPAAQTPPASAGAEPEQAGRAGTTALPGSAPDVRKDLQSTPPARKDEGVKKPQLSPEEQARLQEEQARKQEELARKREEQARQKEEQRLQREEQARLKKEEQDRLKEEQRLKREELARQKEEQRLKREEEARLKREEEARKKEEQRLKREEEARLKKEAEARKLEEARLKAEQERIQKEEARKKEEEAARLKAEQEKKEKEAALKRDVQAIVAAGQQNSKVPDGCTIMINGKISKDYQSFRTGLRMKAYSNVKVTSVATDGKGNVTRVNVTATESAEH